METLSKLFWKYSPDMEEALVRYALTITILLLGVGLFVAVSASRLQLPQPANGHLQSIAGPLGFAIVAVVGFTLAIELHASAKGWPIVWRITSVLGLVLVFIVGLGAPYLLPQYAGSAFFMEPHPLAVAGILMAIAASASGVGTDRANIRITVFLMAALLAWVIAYLCGFLFHGLLGVRGSWRLSGTNLSIVAIISTFVGLGFVARWLPDADDRPDGDKNNGGDISELARTILPPNVLLAIRYGFLIIFALASIIVIGAILNSAAHGRLTRSELPIFSAPAATFLAIMTGFWAFAWPFRERSRLFSMLSKLMLPILVVSGLIVLCTAVYFEYRAVTVDPFTDPIKQIGHPLSSAKIHKLVISWSMSAVVLITALVVLLWQRGRDLRLFTAIAALALVAISVGPLNVNSSYASRINAELRPLLQKHALTTGSVLRPKDEIKWPEETSILARSLVIRLAGIAALGNLPISGDERTRLFEQDAPSFLPTKRLSAVLKRLNLGPATMVSLRRSRDRFVLYFRSQQAVALDVTGYDIAFETTLRERRELTLDGRKVLQYWKLRENGQLIFSIEDKVTARFDLTPLLNRLVDQARERQRARELNRIARETGGTPIPQKREEDKQQSMVLNSLGDGAQFRLLLQGLRVSYNKGKFSLGFGGRGWLLINKQALVPLGAAQDSAAGKP